MSPDLARYRAQCVVLARHRYRCLSLTGSTPCLPRSMRGLSSHVIAVIACSCPASSPVATAIAVSNVHIDCPRIGLAIARDAWSVLARHRYRRLSLTGSTPCRARARCVVCVSPSSLSSLVIDGFDTLPRSRVRCVECVSTSSLSSLFIGVFDTLPRSRAMCGLC